jgi:hypothetical protein
LFSVRVQFPYLDSSVKWAQFSCLPSSTIVSPLI